MTARNPNWVEQDYRIYADDAVQASATALAAINTPADVSLNTAIRILLNVGDTNNATQNHTTTWQLQFRRNGGTWTNVGTNSTSGVSGAGLDVVYSSSDFVADLNNYTTQRLNAISGSTYTSARNEFSTDALTASFTWADQYAELEFCVRLMESTYIGDTVEFRVVATGAVVPTITNTPTVTVAGGGGDTFARRVYVMP